MVLKDYQEQVDKWIKQHTSGYWPPLVKLACLIEETGELAKEINHIYGNKKKRPEEAKKRLEEELVDVLFTLICIANDEELDLDKAWKKMLEEKLYGRDKDRYEVL